MVTGRKHSRLSLTTIAIVFAMAAIALALSGSRARKSAAATAANWNQGLATARYRYLSTQLVLYRPPHSILAFPARVVRYLVPDRTIGFHVSLLGNRVSTSHEF